MFNSTTVLLRFIAAKYTGLFLLRNLSHPGLQGRPSPRLGEASLPRFLGSSGEPSARAPGGGQPALCRHQLETVARLPGSRPLGDAVRAVSLSFLFHPAPRPRQEARPARSQPHKRTLDSAVLLLPSLGPGICGDVGDASSTHPVVPPACSFPDSHGQLPGGGGWGEAKARVEAESPRRRAPWPQAFLTPHPPLPSPRPLSLPTSSLHL